MFYNVRRFTPTLLAGTMVGSLLSVIFPEWLIVVLLVSVLGFSTVETLKKGYQKWAARSDARGLLADQGGDAGHGFPGDGLRAGARRGGVLGGAETEILSPLASPDGAEAPALALGKNLMTDMNVDPRHDLFVWSPSSAALIALCIDL